MYDEIMLSEVAIACICSFPYFFYYDTCFVLALVVYVPVKRTHRYFICKGLILTSCVYD